MRVDITKEQVWRTRGLACRVARYSTWPTLKEQSTGAHSCRVAQIYCELFGLPRAEVLYYLLHHDSGELFGGDTPYGAKRAVPALKKAVEEAEEEGARMLEITWPSLDEDERRRAKIADLAEMNEFGEIELAMGNKFAVPIVAETEKEILKLVTLEESKFFYRWKQGEHRD